MEHNNIEVIVDTIIESALDVRSSDIHIDPMLEALVVSFRIDGVIRHYRDFSIDIHEGVMLRIKVLARLPFDEKRLPKDGKFVWRSRDGARSAEVRVSMMPTIYGENAVLRLFDPLISIFSLSDLGFSKPQEVALCKALDAHAGLIMIAGPTGSGKTTTLYSSLKHIRSSHRLVVTIEHPVERRIDDVRQIEVGGYSKLEYASVLRSVLRQDPDVIMIGEIRDNESAELAIESALTGHLVISTIHAMSAEGIRERLLHMGVPSYLLDATLICSMSQRLVSKVCTRCMVNDASMDTYAPWFEYEGISMPSMFFKKGAGCGECNQTGISGRTIVAEIAGHDASLQKEVYHRACSGIIPFSEVLRISYA